MQEENWLALAVSFVENLGFSRLEIHLTWPRKKGGYVEVAACLHSSFRLEEGEGVAVGVLDDCEVADAWDFLLPFDDCRA